MPSIPNNKSCGTIAMQLGTTPPTIGRNIKRYGAMGKLEDKGRSKRPHILSERDDHYLAQLVQTKEHTIAIKCQRVLRKVSNIIASPNIVRRALKRQGL